MVYPFPRINCRYSSFITPPNIRPVGSYSQWTLARWLSLFFPMIVPTGGMCRGLGEGSFVRLCLSLRANCPWSVRMVTTLADQCEGDGRADISKGIMGAPNTKQSTTLRYSRLLSFISITVSLFMLGALGLVYALEQGLSREVRSPPRRPWHSYVPCPMYVRSS